MNRDWHTQIYMHTHTLTHRNRKRAWMRHAVMKSHSFQRELSNPFPHISETNLLYLPHTDFLSDGAHLAAPDQTQALPPERRLSPSARHRWDDPWYRGTCVEATNPPKNRLSCFPMIRIITHYLHAASAMLVRFCLLAYLFILLGCCLCLLMDLRLKLNLEIPQKIEKMTKNLVCARIIRKRNSF